MIEYVGHGSPFATPDVPVLVFDDATARDAFYAIEANRLTLRTGVTTIILSDGPTEEIWGGANAPPVYDNLDWIDLSGALLSAAEVKTLYESNADTNALTDGKLQVLSRLTEESGRLVSALPIEVPAGTVYIGPGVGLSASVRALSVRSAVTGNAALLIAQLFDDTNGFGAAFIYAGSVVDTVQFNDPLGTDITDIASFPLTATEDELIIAIEIATETPNSPGIPFTIEGRIGGVLALSFAGNLTTDALGIAKLDLARDLYPILLDAGMVIDVVMTCVGVVSVDEGGGVFVPNASVDRIVLTREAVATQIATSRYVAPVIQRLASPIDGRHPLGEDLNGLQTFDFMVLHSQHLDGNLTLTVDGTGYPVVPSEGDQQAQVTLTGINSAAERSFDYQITGTDIKGNPVVSDAVAVTYVIQGTARWIVSSTPNVSTIDSLSMIAEVVDEPGDFFNIMGTLPSSQYIHILMPDTHDLVSIVDAFFNEDVTSDFTRVPASSTQDGVTGILYTLRNVAGAVTIAYRVTV